MMELHKLLSASQMQQADLFTIKNEPISSLDLMNRASLAFVNELLQTVDLSDKKIAVLCGTGNNGGDGFVVSEILKKKGFNVSPFLIQFRKELSPDCQKNFEKRNDVHIVSDNDVLTDLSSFDILIDALLGTGITRPTEGLVAKVIDTMNSSGAKIFSIDLPSGLFADSLTPSGSIVQSDLVISFQRAKKAFFYPENNEYVREWNVVDIGLNEAFLQQQDSNEFVLDHRVSKFLKPRKRYSHKGTYGHALMMLGSYGKMGAAVLASMGCLRSGVGLLTVYSPKCGYEILQTSVAEAMCVTDKNELFITQLPDIKKYDAIGIGPGLGIHFEITKVIERLFQTVQVPLVLDADALNIISESEALEHHIPKGSVLTPHIKEFDRLFGASKNSQERYEKQRAFSKKQKVVIVLKDAHTCVSDTEGNLYFNTSGNPGMATGGSGDVLAGIITGLLAQNYTSIEAALLGVYFHGLAGDEAAKAKGEYSMIASDIVTHLKLS